MTTEHFIGLLPETTNSIKYAIISLGIKLRYYTKVLLCLKVSEHYFYCIPANSPLNATVHCAKEGERNGLGNVTPLTPQPLSNHITTETKPPLKLTYQTNTKAGG